MANKINTLKAQIKKLINMRYAIFIVFTISAGLSAFILLLMDKVNFCKPSGLYLENWIAIFKHNFTVFDWLILTINFLWIYFALAVWTFYFNIKTKVFKKFSNTKKNVITYNVVFFGSITIILGILIMFLAIFFPWNILTDQSTVFNGPNMISSLGIFLLVFIIIFTLTSFAAYLVYYARPIYFALATSFKNLIAKCEERKKENKKKKEIRTKLKKQKYDKMIEETLPWQIFPALNAIDVENTGIQISEANEEKKVIKTKQNTENILKDFAKQFQAFLANKHQLYFELPILRAFIAGLNASRIILLEGISGTGKTTLPRMFNEFVGGKANFFPVQATWRDRTDLVGYYSEFSKQFKETEFLKSLYSASYNLSNFNMMVLDEMNISRVEYYFADFLSILEYPQNDWLVPLMNSYRGVNLPTKLEKGKIKIPNNTWFVGTINVDDSTFTVSDKVYDRAIVIDFKELTSPIKCNFKDDPWPMTPIELKNAFDYCSAREEYHLSIKEKDKFAKLCDYAANVFDIAFGNRIYNQIIAFLPPYVGLGGTKNEALDFMFSRKILRKIDGKYENYVRTGLGKLQKYLWTSYGKGVFTETEIHINKLLKKLQ